MNLLELQRRMAADVQRPLTPDFQMQQIDEQGRSVREIADSYIKPNPLLSSFDRLEIYNRQYWFRVIGAVSEDFPALNAVVGEKKFDALVLAYLQANPSTSYTLRDLSARLPAWLAAHPQMAAPRHHLASEVARLEWAYVEAYDQASVIPLGLADFAALGSDSTLRLQPHLQLLHLHYPVDEIVLAVRRQTPELDIVSNAVSEHRHTARVTVPKVRRANIHLAVHRFENSVYYRRIDREAFRMLSALRDGASIATALEQAFAGSRLSARTQADRTQAYFAHAAELGWFCMPPPAGLD